MAIHLSEHFNYGKLIRFTVPTIVMMIFTSIYGVVDGVFVSNFAGKTAFAAVNLIMPALMIFGTVGFMLGTGGSAIVAKTLGEGDPDRARRYFTLFIWVGAIAGLVLTALGWCVMRPLSAALGAKGGMLELCVRYGRIMCLGTVPFILQNMFQSFLVAAERPKLGLGLTVAAGLTNMLGDYLLVGVLPWGVAGAAIATVLSQLVGGVVPLIYFLLPGCKSPLRLTRTRFEGRILRHACANGSSEMLSNLSMSLMSMLYNLQLMRLIGEDGVAAYGVIMYVDFIFVAVFLGYSIGAGPIISYHYGAGNQGELRSLLGKSLRLTAASGMLMTALAVGMARPLSRIFVGYDGDLLALTAHGFRLFSLAFFGKAVNIFGSAFFTALNNGAISAVISFLRTLLFQIGAIFILPVFLELDGIWLAVAAAELLAMAVTVFFLVTQRTRYGYGGKVT